MARAKVFISYRRTDALHATSRIRDHMKAAFPDVEVFMDIDSMPVGVDFVRYVEDKVRECSVLLAVIGPNWVAASDRDGRRRLDQVDDVVRIEIAAAIAQGITIVPIVLDGATFPSPDELPENLRPLAKISGLDVRGTSFEPDVERLLARLEPHMKPGAIAVGVGPTQHGRRRWLVPGRGQTEWFSDADVAPQLVVVPAGQAVLGSPKEEPGREPYDRGSETQASAIIERPFAIGRFAVTVGQFAAFVADSGHDVPAGAYYYSDNVRDYRLANNRSWRDPRFAQGDDHPVVAIRWLDACAYATWLSTMTGQHYRLPTSAEWEYAARAGTTTPFHWGTSVSPTNANYDARQRYKGGGERGPASTGTVPVDRYAPNPWGLFQVHGNVWEMCADSWPGYPDCRICRGGSFEDPPTGLRAAMWGYVEGNSRYVSVGFRVVRNIS